MMDEIITRQMALQQAVIAAGSQAWDHSLVLTLARHFAVFLDPATNLAPRSPEQIQAEIVKAQSH